MGNACSEDQAELVNLLTVQNGRIWLLTDKTTESKECAVSTLLKLAPSRLCRWLQFDRQCDIAPEHPLLEFLSKR
jgi:hypothetical protein